MIYRNEIEQKCKGFDINPYDVQRDYVFGWILAGIYSKAGIGNHLVLKGGNGLRKAYFEHARFSADLDLSTEQPVHADALGTQLNSVCEFAEQNAGISFFRDKTRVEEKKLADSDKRIYEARLYFRDFYGNPEKFTVRVRLDIAEFDKIILPVQARNLIHPYSDKTSCSVPIRCFKLEEILADKLKCLLQRRHSVDLYDFVFSILLNSYLDVNRSEIVETFLNKTIFRPSPGIVKGLLIDLPFNIIKGLWDKYIIAPAQGLIDFDKAVSVFKDTINSLFGSLHIGRGKLIFFPPNFRNVIMEAGYSLTLLDIVYNRVQRLVEPYSLVYKRRQDGIAREYLYVYDLSGGKSRTQSIKTFVHTNIQSIRNTDKTFEPRLPVELSKAGELQKSSYFGKSPKRNRQKVFTPRFSRHKRSRFDVRQYLYTVQCPICGKTFRRKHYNAKLNPHKDKYGNRCYGRFGIMI